MHASIVSICLVFHHSIVLFIYSSKTVCQSPVWCLAEFRALEIIAGEKTEKASPLMALKI